MVEAPLRPTNKRRYQVCCWCTCWKSLLDPGSAPPYEMEASHSDPTTTQFACLSFHILTGHWFSNRETRIHLFSQTYLVILKSFVPQVRTVHYWKFLFSTIKLISPCSFIVLMHQLAMVRLGLFWDVDNKLVCIVTFASEVMKVPHPLSR